LTLCHLNQFVEDNDDDDDDDDGRQRIRARTTVDAKCIVEETFIRNLRAEWSDVVAVCHVA